MSRVSSVLLPVAAALALLAGACSSDEDSGGLATLVDTAPTAPVAVPETEQVETAGIATTPEATEATSPAADEAAAADDSDAATPAEPVPAQPGEDAEDAPDDSATATPTQPEPTQPGDNAGDAASEPPATAAQPEATEPDAGRAGADDDDLSDEEQLLRFADCMRANGVDFPDPVVEADGTVTFGFHPGTGGGSAELGRDPDLPAARDACVHLLEGLSFGPGSGASRFEVTESEDTLLEFARCMRANGVDMGDPDLSGLGRGGGVAQPFGEIDFGDADVQAAFEVCQAEVNLPGLRRGGAPPPRGQ